MPYKRTAVSFLFTGLIFVAITAGLLMTATPASAQCGSQASSCKNCHEVQGQDPVSADGTNWHQSHAFGDFCYICHGGNNQAKDKTAAHEGMVPPLSDVKASCQQCHAADLDARAKVYADVLGVQVDSGSAAPAISEPAAAGTTAVPVSADTSAADSSDQCDELILYDPNTVNYTQNYDQIVLGKKPVNWGNMVLLGIIGLMVVGGGGFVATREKLVNVKFGDTRKVEREYPSDVVEILPKIAELKPETRRSLRNVLENKKADKILDLLDEVTKKDGEQ